MVSCDLSSSGLNTSPGQQLHPGKHNGLHIPPCSEGLRSCRPLNAQLHPSNSTYLLQSANTTRWADSLALWHSCSSSLSRAGHRQPLSSTLKYIRALIHDHIKKIPIIQFASKFLAVCSSEILNHLSNTRPASNPRVLACIFHTALCTEEACCVTSYI